MSIGLLFLCLFDWHDSHFQWLWYGTVSENFANFSVISDKIAQTVTDFKTRLNLSGRFFSLHQYKFQDVFFFHFDQLKLVKIASSYVHIKCSQPMYFIMDYRLYKSIHHFFCSYSATVCVVDISKSCVNDLLIWNGLLERLILLEMIRMTHKFDMQL